MRILVSADLVSGAAVGRRLRRGKPHSRAHRHAGSEKRRCRPPCPPRCLIPHATPTPDLDATVAKLESRLLLSSCFAVAHAHNPPSRQCPLQRETLPPPPLRARMATAVAVSADSHVLRSYTGFYFSGISAQADVAANTQRPTPHTYANPQHLHPHALFYRQPFKRDPHLYGETATAQLFVGDARASHIFLWTGLVPTVDVHSDPSVRVLAIPADAQTQRQPIVCWGTHARLRRPDPLPGSFDFCQCTPTVNTYAAAC